MGKEDNKPIPPYVVNNLLALGQLGDSVVEKVVSYLRAKRSKTMKLGEMICNINLDEERN